MVRSGQLGDFVRTRRARVSPELVGSTPAPGAACPGLRREELARLAHVSIDYIVRLEQGRIGRPSTDILEALARGLLLDSVERRHLFRLAATSEPAHTTTMPARGCVAGSSSSCTVSSPALAVVLSRRLDLLVWNPTAEALLGRFGASATTRGSSSTTPPPAHSTPTGRRPRGRRSRCFAWRRPAIPTIEALRELIAELRSRSDEAALVGCPRRLAEAPRSQALPPPDGRRADPSLRGAAARRRRRSAAHDLRSPAGHAARRAARAASELAKSAA